MMFRPFALFIGLRYTRAKHKNYFISFMALTSMLGIALGVAVLITVLSVMNGFDQEIKTRFFRLAPQLTVLSGEGSIRDWPALQKKISDFPSVVAVAPFVGKQGLLSVYQQDVNVVVSGVLPELEKKMSAVSQSMQAGSLDSLRAGDFNIIVGKLIADRLGLSLGDKVTLILPQLNLTPTGAQARLKRFTVSGVFSTGSGFGFDDNLTFVNLEDAQALLMLGKQVTGFRVKLEDLYQAPQVSMQLFHYLEGNYVISNWTEQFGAFFHAVKMEKNIMFLILVLIIGVAAFNLVSSLVMMVADKRTEIAIMRTYGVLARTVMAIFMVQGILIGCMGTALGLVAGLLLASNVTPIVDLLQQVFQTELFTKGVYYTDFLPSQILARDVIKVACIAISMSFFATLYPAWRASKVQPAEALRYE
jgi:lipoprotein-releasing system permease protein